MLARRRDTALALVGALVAAAVAAVCADRLAQTPAADVARGSEQAFVRSGLYERELPPGGKPLRWARAESTWEFRRLPEGPATLRVEAQGHQAPLRVTVDGSVVGSIAPGARAGEWPILLHHSDVEIGLEAAPFRAGDGRLLGTQPRRIVLAPSAHALASVAPLALLLLLPALAVALMARVSGLRLWPALGLTAAAIASMAALLCWCGTLHAPYAEHVAATLTIGAALSGAFAWLVSRRRPEARSLAFTAALVAAGVHLILVPSSLMTVSDAVFQSHQLERVARGDLFLTSVTQHATPFRIPYGVSFYALLTPFLKLGLDAVALVRWGAGISGLLGALALFAALAPRSPRLAAWSVLLLQTLPGTFQVHSQGNLNNVFGQALTTMFVAWWIAGAPGGWALGAVLFALAGIGHLSSAIVLAALCVALAVVGWRDLREGGSRRGGALLAGGVAVAAYYACFARLMLSDLPRLAQGAGQGTGQSFATVALEQWRGASLEVLGLPALVLALVGWCALDHDRLRRVLGAFLLAGAALLGLALVSPVEVRYLYALTTPVAILGAAGVDALWPARGWKRVAALVLAATQAVLGGWNLVERLFFHYR